MSQWKNCYEDSIYIVFILIEPDTHCLDRLGIYYYAFLICHLPLILYKKFRKKLFSINEHKTDHLYWENGEILVAWDEFLCFSRFCLHFVHLHSCRKSNNWILNEMDFLYNNLFTDIRSPKCSSFSCKNKGQCITALAQTIYEDNFIIRYCYCLSQRSATGLDCFRIKF